MGNFIKLINENKVVLVDFYASWCEPCKIMSPILKEAKVKFSDKVTIVKIDVEKNESTSRKFNVKGVPTFILFKEGKAVWRKSGVTNLSQLETEISPFL